MKNQKERNEFLINPASWKPVFTEGLTRVEKLTYKGEDRYRLMVYQWNNHFYYETHTAGHIAEWTVKDYYRLNEIDQALEVQSLTEMREWIYALDKKYPDRASGPAIPATVGFRREAKKSEGEHTDTS